MSHGYDAICIPTYGRADTIGTDTLNTLAAANTDPSTVHVFVGPSGDYTAARAMHSKVNWHEAPAGYSNAHNHIRDTFPAGHRIVIMDDDVTALRQLDGKRLAPFEGTQWSDTLTEAFTWAAQERITLWGASPTANPFYMRHLWKTGLQPVFGFLYGFINDPATRLEEDGKQDIELTLAHYTRDGAVGRINDVVAVTRPMREYPGGLQIGDRDAREIIATRNLLRRFPSLTEYNPNGAHHQDDLKLRKQR